MEYEIEDITRTGELKTVGEVINYLNTFSANTPILFPSPSGRVLGVDMYTEKTKKVIKGNQFCAYDAYETDKNGELTVSIDNIM